MTGARAAVVAVALLAAGCTSTTSGTATAVGGSGSPTSGGTSSAGSSSATPGGGSPTDYTELLLTQAELPAGFEIQTDDPMALETYLTSLDLPELPGATIVVEPPQCTTTNPFADVAPVRLVDTINFGGATSLVQVAGPAGGGLGGLRELLVQCATVSVRAELPGTGPTGNSATTVVLADPAVVAADEVLAFTTTNTLVVPGEPPEAEPFSASATYAYATVGPAVVGLRVLPLGGQPVDEALLAEALGAAVAKARR